MLFTPLFWKFQDPIIFSADQVQVPNGGVFSPLGRQGRELQLGNPPNSWSGSEWSQNFDTLIFQFVDIIEHTLGEIYEVPQC